MGYGYGTWSFQVSRNIKSSKKDWDILGPKAIKWKTIDLKLFFFKEGICELVYWSESASISRILLLKHCDKKKKKK